MKKHKLDLNYGTPGRNIYSYNPLTLPISVGNAKQLLCDDFFLRLADADKWDELFYNVKFANGIVQKHGSPVMEGDEEDWETGIAWLNVIKENNLYRTWHMSYTLAGPKVGYAESEDGIHWVKPKLGIIEVNGSKENNVVYDGGFQGGGVEFGNVFHDPHGRPDEQYKMVYAQWTARGEKELRAESVRTGTHLEVNGNVRGASSPDGIHWLRYPGNIRGSYHDTQNLGMWDPTLEKYVVYHRSGTTFGAIDTWNYKVKGQRRGRAVGRIESDDFQTWTTSEVALAPDVLDGLNTDIYNSAYARHPDNPNVHYLFPSFYRHYEGTFEVQVCTSRDNRNWTRICRDTFIPLGNPGEFDCFIVSVSPGIVKVDDTTWALYYRSGDGPHRGCPPSKFELDYQTKSRMSRVTFKEDRVIGIEAGKEKGHFSTRPLSFEGNELIINSEPLGSDAELKVQLISGETNEAIPGYDFESCESIKSDGTRTVVKWKGKNGLDSSISRKSVRLHFNMQSTRIYAFQFIG